MNIEKRKKYGNTLTINGIDTVSGYVTGQITDVSQGVSKAISNINYSPQKDRTLVKINPNKVGGEEHLITRYSEFLRVMELILLGIGAWDIDYIRADFCFNSTDLNSYEMYKKTNRLMLLCLSYAYGYRNTYETTDLWDGQLLSMAIKKDDSEVEYYNKYLASDGKDECANRLEIRSKRMSGTTIQYQFLDRWFNRLDYAIEYFEEVQHRANEKLKQRWELDQASEKRQYYSFNAFLVQHESNIFTRKQMIELISELQPEVNAQKKADKLKERYKIEYFTRKDLEYIVQVLKSKITEYFEQ